MVVDAYQLMLNLETDDVASFPVLNGVGFFFGLVSVVALFVQQSLTTLLPLLVPIVVCVVLCTVLIRSQENTTTGGDDVSPSPIKIDVI